jgi:hypothetical protein
MVEHRLQRPHIAAHAKVLVVASKLGAQDLMLLGQVLVAIVPERIVEKEVRQQRAGDTSYNVAKHGLESTLNIDCIHM